MHTNNNSVCLININLIIMKVIPQPAHTENSVKKGQQLYSIFTNRLDSIISICLKANHKQKESLRYDIRLTNSH